MDKKLVVYFSASGTTRDVAEKISDKGDFGIVEIEPKVKYSNADLNWRDENSRSSQENRDKEARPEIFVDVIDLDDYCKIILGFPIWWNTAPKVINTFLESFDFTDKEIIPFATSGCSGIENAVKELKPFVDDGKVKEGMLLNESSEEMISRFLESI